MSLSVRSIVLILLCVLATPLHIYACFKLHQFQNHFLINNRFPALLIVVSISTFILNYVIVIRSCLIDNGAFEWNNIKTQYILQAFILSLSYFSVNIIFYRAHLVHLQYLQQNTGPSNNTPKNVSKQCSSRLLFICIIVTTLVIFVAPFVLAFSNNTTTLTNTFNIFWILTAVIGLIYIAAIKCRGTEEKLGILMDIGGSAAMIVVLLLLYFVPNQDIYTTMHILMQNIMAVFPLFYTLMFLRKHEGSLEPQKVMNKTYSYQNPDRHRGLYSETDIEKMPLFVFLRKQENYNTFTAYLRMVFAVENIKFVTNVLVLYHSVLSYKEKSKKEDDLDEDAYVEEEQAPEEAEAGADPDTETVSSNNHILYSIKLEYLETLYQTFQSFMVKNVTSRDPIFYDLKDNLFSLSQQLYVRFIADDAPERIYIAYELQQNLCALLGNEESKDKFHCFDDFLHLFQDAMLDAWNAMENCYGFNFKEYLSDVGNQQRTERTEVNNKE